GVIAKLLGSTGFSFLDRVLGHLERRATSAVERERVAAGREAAANATAASVVREGMQYWPFWIPWLMATVPLTAWFGWGMLDTLTNGALPDVAEIPRGLLPWAQAAWDNIFYTGGGVAAVTAIAAAIRGRR